MKYKYHYVYRITNITKVALRIYYYGVHSSNLRPENDIGVKYFSSSTNKEFIKDQKENPQNYSYKIIKAFKTREDATELEVKLHKKFNVKLHQKFYNKANQTSTGFDRTGVSSTEEHKRKIGDGNRGKSVSIETRAKNGLANSRRVTKDITRGKISKFNKGKKLSTETKQKMKKPKTKEHKVNMSKARRGIPQRRVICPHCDKEGGATNMSRYHFDKCKVIL